MRGSDLASRIYTGVMMILREIEVSYAIRHIKMLRKEVQCNTRIIKAIQYNTIPYASKLYSKI